MPQVDNENDALILKFQIMKYIYKVYKEKYQSYWLKSVKRNKMIERRRIKKYVAIGQIM